MRARPPVQNVRPNATSGSGSFPVCGSVFGAVATVEVVVAGAVVVVAGAEVVDVDVGGAVVDVVVAVPALTMTVLLVPVIDEVAVSVAVIVWFPAVFNVAENVPVPFVNVESAGNTAAPSLAVKCTVPA
jgi:hypothetical protein